MKHQILWLRATSCDCSLDSRVCEILQNQIGKIAQLASPKFNRKIASSIAIRWLTVQYCVITFSPAESDMSDFTAVLPVDSRTLLLIFKQIPLCQRKCGKNLYTVVAPSKSSSLKKVSKLGLHHTLLSNSTST